jgi:hypothetical protein
MTVIEVRKPDTQTDRIIKLEKAVRWLLPYAVQFGLTQNAEKAIKFAQDVLEGK